MRLLKKKRRRKPGLEAFEQERQDKADLGY
ncbi:MAG: hypothetical protein M2R46_00388 [Verrucomicrobia subdivision 3 bacterium]|nr:hypothetical protein [Limisphaerales bacterium]